MKRLKINASKTLQLWPQMGTIMTRSSDQENISSFCVENKVDNSEQRASSYISASEVSAASATTKRHKTEKWYLESSVFSEVVHCIKRLRTNELEQISADNEWWLINQSTHSF